MITIRKSQDRGLTKASWLDSKHTFSFGSYYDPAFMNFGALRVINEDKVSPDQGFGAHSHRDMEIISYVLDGSLEHKDSLGTGSIIVPGEVQVMRAGVGITHSEFNPSKDTPIHFLQIWIIPDQTGLAPSYQQRNFQNIRKKGQLTLLVSPQGEQESLIIHQDFKMYVLDLDPHQTFSHSLKVGRMAWVQVARGEITLNDKELKQGDGAAVVQEETLNFLSLKEAEILIFDVESA
jgi:redox-sensitive bicupin YhaK (pirin superfamily)